jgi:hypothetical protein
MGQGGATSEKDLWANGSMPAIRQIPWQRGPGASGHKRTVVSVKNAVRDVWLQTRKLSGKHYGKSEGGQVRTGRVQLLADFSLVSYLFQQVEIAGTTSFVGGSLAYVQLASSAIRLRSLPLAGSPLPLRAIYLTSHRKRSRKVLFSSEPADAPEFAAHHRARSAPGPGW